MAVFRAFRAGSTQPPQRHALEELQSFTEFFDSMKPDNRQGRLGALFASANIESMARWFNAGRNSEISEIRISDPDNVYAYPVHLWEEVHLATRSTSVDIVIREYWNSGVKLSELCDNPQFLAAPRGEWEILVPMESVSSIVPVSHKRFLQQCDLRDHTRLHSALQHGVYFNGTCNRCREAEELV